jgi:hypothetical protein
MSTGYCATKGRWIIEESTSICKEYDTPGKFSERISDTYLKCKTCKDTSSNPTNSPPCYKGNPKASIASPTTNCEDGKLAVLKKDGSSTTGHCISAGIIDNCRIYTSITGTPSPNTGAGCDTCSDGYTKVDTQFSH